MATETWVDVHGRRWWVDCPSCDVPRPPQVVTVRTLRGFDVECPRQEVEDVPARLYRCAECGTAGAIRRIRIRTKRGAAPKGCSSACLNGQTSCDCVCNGRCHGAGECRCVA